MKTGVRIIVVILCIIALYYLVVLLARGVARGETDLGPARIDEGAVGAYSSASTERREIVPG